MPLFPCPIRSIDKELEEEEEAAVVVAGDAEIIVLRTVTPISTGSSAVGARLRVPRTRVLIAPREMPS